jgi:hypothetical protein
MSKKRDFHVVPSPSGGWSVRREGAERASAVFHRKSDAMERGRELARSSQSEVIIHGKDGRIREANSYHNPPRDRPQDRGASPKGFGSLGGGLAVRRDIDVTKPIYQQAMRDTKKGSHRDRTK